VHVVSLARDAPPIKRREGPAGRPLPSLQLPLHGREILHAVPVSAKGKLRMPATS
jgi:hypothetical protein